MDTIYAIYFAFILLSFLVYNIDAIYHRFKPFYYKSLKAIKNPRVLRDASLAMVVNALFSLLNTSSFLGVCGYLILTLIGMVGIIVSNDKIQD